MKTNDIFIRQWLRINLNKRISVNRHSYYTTTLQGEKIKTVIAQWDDIKDIITYESGYPSYIEKSLDQDHYYLAVCNKGITRGESCAYKHKLTKLTQYQSNGSITETERVLSNNYDKEPLSKLSKNGKNVIM